MSEPHKQHRIATPKAGLAANTSSFDPHIAGIALAKGLIYLKERLGWSGNHIAKLLHLPSNTFNTWLKNGAIPISGHTLSPDVQAITHLLAVHRSLEAMFDNTEHQQLWLNTHHPELNAIPQALMISSLEGLIQVRQYLDYIRGRGA
ncbi:MAG TPA: MbcA/ParS/Xre antitoxin family protein [Gammaproteobacteria bacterium]|nr:MbcA/ParS/Xre antitoxin family protein [Gammaproteobacteria bacterium]